MQLLDIGQWSRQTSITQRRQQTNAQLLQDCTYFQSYPNYSERSSAEQEDELRRFKAQLNVLRDQNAKLELKNTNLESQHERLVKEVRAFQNQNDLLSIDVDRLTVNFDSLERNAETTKDQLLLRLNEEMQINKKIQEHFEKEKRVDLESHRRTVKRLAKRTSDLAEEQ